MTDEQITQAVALLGELWSQWRWWGLLVGVVIVGVNTYKLAENVLPEAIRFSRLRLRWQLVIVALAAGLATGVAKLGAGMTLAASIVAGIVAALGAAGLHAGALKPAAQALLPRVTDPKMRYAMSLVFNPGTGKSTLAPPSSSATTGERGAVNVRVLVAVLVAAGLLGVAAVVRAQTVYSKQDTSLTGTGGSKLAAVACTAAAAARWTGWISVATQREVVFDVDFVDADASAASLDVRCETSRTSATAADAGRELPVITATSAAGVSSMTRDSRSWVSTTGGAPGTSSFTVTFANIPAPWINCLWTCGAGGAAADTITVYARGITP